MTEKRMTTKDIDKEIAKDEKKSRAVKRAEKRAEKKEKRKYVGQLRTAVRHIAVDVPSLSSSRKSGHDTLAQMAEQIVNGINIMIPDPFFMEARILSSNKSPQFVISVNLLIKMSSWHEFTYFMKMKIPFLRNFIAGPKIISNLIPSRHSMKKNNPPSMKIVGGA